MRYPKAVEQHYTQKQLCELLGVSRATLNRMEQSGALRVHRLPTGGKRYPASAVNRCLYCAREVRA